jgi:hypothetical protein
VTSPPPYPPNQPPYPPNQPPYPPNQPPYPPNVPPAPPVYPPAFPPGYPPAAAPPAGGGRIPPWLVIVGVVVILLVLGGLGVLLSRAGGAVEATASRAADPVETGVLTPLPDAPTPSTVPITPVPEPTSTEQPTAPPEPTELPTTPTVEPTESPTPIPSGTQTVDLGGGLSVAVPDGWGVLDGPTDGSVLLGNDEAIAFVDTATGFDNTTGGEVALLYAQQVLADQLERLKLGDPQPLAVDSPTVVSAAVLPYRGVIVGQQGGQQVTGSVYVYVRQDGTALVVDETQRPDTDVTAEMDVILGSLLATF